MADRRAYFAARYAANRGRRPQPTAGMKFAYADPPYLGCCKLYNHNHPDGRCWDDLGTTTLLIYRLYSDYPDGWALSCTSGSLAALLPNCPEEARVMAWVKPFASFKPNVGVAYAWEPVIVYGGRKRTREQSTVRDWHSAVITLRKGLTGAKPPSFCRWLLDVFNYQDGDTLDDLFPGTNVMTEAARQGVLL